MLCCFCVGVAVGAGWQATVAYINIACYYIVGLPLGILLGFTFKFGVEVNICRMRLRSSKVQESI